MTRVLYAGQMATTRCGTPAYMAPEILSGNGYTYTCDFWCVGIVMFEMMSGSLPFGKSKPSNTIKWSKKLAATENFKDLCSKLLKIDPSERLGCINGLDEILDHEWFTNEEDGIDIEAVLEKTYVPDYIPEHWEETDEHNFFKMTTGQDVIRQSMVTEAERRKIENQKALFEQFQIVGGESESESE